MLQDLKARLDGWSGLSIARAVCLGLGWLLLCVIAPRADRLKTHMRASAASGDPLDRGEADLAIELRV